MRKAPYSSSLGRLRRYNLVKLHYITVKKHFGKIYMYLQLAADKNLTHVYIMNIDQHSFSKII